MNNLTLLIRKYPTLLQFSKFFIVGISNTIVDFGIFNLLMWLTSIYKGSEIAIFKAVAFTVAVTNSYILNKYWTFQSKEKAQIPQQFTKFLAVAVAGAVLTVLIVYSITTLMSPLFGLSEVLWANFANVVATVIVLFWNFVGYKFLVFKK